MDFFREQDIARRNARLLTALFVLAVVVLILLTNLLLAAVLFFADASHSGRPHADFLSQLDWRLFLGVGAVIATVIGVVVLVNWLRFARGGREVAEALGGRPAIPASDDPFERRAQNVVQEIALAASTPVPPLYILDDERGINAFAAGVTPANAVIALTRGATVQLTREELQGVIGHEFSHILNGDMRLSIRLAAMLRGITFIGDIGAMLLHSSGHRARHHRRNSKDQGGAIVLGLGLYLIGFLGGVMAGLIKSAIAQQKEYLADASSVQFTRNPDSIGDALKVIGGYTPGSLVHGARAEELSHLFFGQVKHRLWSLFATHPPLEERIRRVDPDWNGEFIRRPPNHRALHPNAASEMGVLQARRSLTAASTGLVSALDSTEVGSAISEQDRPEDPTTELTAWVIEEARNPLGAMSLTLALLWHTDSQSKQLSALEGSAIRGLQAQVSDYGPRLAGLAPGLRLTLTELCLPALKQMSPAQYQEFKQRLLQFIRADGRIDLNEWCLFQLVRHYLDPEFVTARLSRPRYRTLNRVRGPLATALGTLAHLGSDETETAFNRGAALLDLTLNLPTPPPSVQDFSKAVTTLADCYPLLKVSILKAMATVAGHDGRVSAEERALIKAIAAVIDCPTPDAMLSLPTNGEK